MLAIVQKHTQKSEPDLARQLKRASRSVTANIAEGFGRFHYLENIQFCRQTRGSLSESMEHIITSYDEKLITKDLLTDVNRDYKKCLKEINTYIKYLRNAKENNQ